MNTYAVKGWREGDILFKVKNISKNGYSDGCLEGVHIVTCTSNILKYIKIKDSQWKRINIEIVGDEIATNKYYDILLHFEDGDYIFKCKNDEVAKLIFECGGI